MRERRGEEKRQNRGGNWGEKQGRTERKKTTNGRNQTQGEGTTEPGESKGKEKEQTFFPLVSSQRNREVNEPEQRKNAEKKQETWRRQKQREALASQRTSTSLVSGYTTS